MALEAEESMSFPYEDILSDMIEENKIKRFKQKVQDKRSLINAGNKGSQPE